MSTTNKVEIVLDGEQFVRRVTQETPIGTQERFIKQLVEEQQSEINWPSYPTMNGEDFDTTGAVKHLWIGSKKESTVVAMELNFFPLCGASLYKRTDDTFELRLKDPRREEEGSYSQEDLARFRYFDEKPLRIPILPEHNARLFVVFALSSSPGHAVLCILRNGRPYTPYGFPNIFNDGALCGGALWEGDDTYMRRNPSENYSLTSHVKRCLSAFLASPPNNDLTDRDKHRTLGSWNEEGNLTATSELLLGDPSSGEFLCSFIKHLNGTNYA